MRALFVAVLAFTLAQAPQAAQKTEDLGVPSKDGLVVCTSAPACDAGASVMAKGGNAVDAAVATAFALAVTHPAAGNIGGGGFMVVRTPSGEVTRFDYREQAPLKSTRTMYLGADGNIDGSLTRAGLSRAGRPGLGSRPGDGAQEVRQAAVEGRRDAGRRCLPSRASSMSASLARGLNREVQGPMAPFPASVAAYGKPGGGEWKEPATASSRRTSARRCAPLRPTVRTPSTRAGLPTRSPPT